MYLFPPGGWENPVGTKLSKVIGSKQIGVSLSTCLIVYESLS